MADNPNLRGGRDRERIALGQEHEVRYWTETLGVTRQELETAVREVGNDAGAVRRRLADSRH